MAKQVQHAAKSIQRKDHVVTTTLCGRMNARTRDGMNIASERSQVTCKFCLRLLAAQEAR